MPSLRIVTFAPFADRLRDNLARAADRALDAELVGVPTEGGNDMAEAIRGADVLVNGVFRREWAGTAPKLRLVHAVGAGYEGIALDAVPPGCQVANVYGHAYGIAEYAFMVMAALNRDLFRVDRDLREGRWTGGLQRELRGRSLLIVGLGHIGREVARWGRFIGMRVSAVTEHPSEGRRQTSNLFALGSLDDLAAFVPEADFVVVAVPQSDSTRDLVDERVLAAMRPTAYLVNVGRGPVVDQWALYRALSEGRIAGAAIDVWYRYPEGDVAQLPSDAPFHELANVILTPHMSGYTEGTMRHRYAAIAENIRRLVDNEPLDNVVWPRL